jgi:DNA-binding CsgD family transcriptional regulator
VKTPDSAASGWPFAGRQSELSMVRASVATGGAIVSGEAGAGKSRLVAEAAHLLTGFTVVRATATRASATIPFGSFAHIIDEAHTGEPNLLRGAAEQLRTAADPHDLLLLVDDAHWLDPASAALVHHLVLHSGTPVLATVRDGEAAPDPVVALWKDGLLPRFGLAPLTSGQVAEVLAAALGGPAERGAVRYLTRVTAGNLLYLRELVLAGRQSGTLSEVDGVWSWQGQLSLTPRLRELIGARVGQLDPTVREVLELVALGEPLGAHLLAELTSVGAVERAEDRALVRTSSDGRRWQVRLGHPLYGEAVRDQCGPLRTRRRLQQLAHAVHATGMRRREDMLRVAVWKLDSHTASDPQVQLSAARLAWVRGDPALAARLATAAVESGGGLEATAVLAELLLVLGRGDEAQALLQRPGTVASDVEQTRHAISLALVLACGGATNDARQVLADTATVTDVRCRQDVLIHRGVVEFYAGRLDESARLAEQVRALGPPAASEAGHVAALEAWLHAYSGRTRVSLEICASALADRSHWQDEAPHALPSLLEARCAAHLFAGDLTAAERAAEDGLRLADSPGSSDIAVACFGAHLSRIKRLRGEVREAFRLGREHAVRLQHQNPYLGRCLAELAHAAALVGEVAIARQALAEGEPIAAHWAFTHPPVRLSRAWIAAAEGGLQTAIREATAAADIAERSGLSGYLMFALHDVVRLGAASLVANRLAALADQMDGALVGICARHAGAAADSDGRAMYEVSQAFEQCGMLLYAAEAAAQASTAFRQEGRNASARGAETRAWMLARRFPGVRTPALVSLAAPRLTARQVEIAQLAASGLSNRQIAIRLSLSHRTVANHLQDAYARVGINGREELKDLLHHLVT